MQNWQKASSGGAIETPNCTKRFRNIKDTSYPLHHASSPIVQKSRIQLFDSFGMRDPKRPIWNQNNLTLGESAMKCVSPLISGVGQHTFISNAFSLEFTSRSINGFSSSSFTVKGKHIV